MLIKHGLGGMSDGDADEPSTMAKNEKRHLKSFLRELDAMIRLRSPHTVHVYGKITSEQNHLVLVMELLVGGDLRMLLHSSNQPLPEEQSRRIIEDVCAGMAFLHSKETVHGDLKSANVLLDGAGRAKVQLTATADTRITNFSNACSSHPCPVLCTQCMIGVETKCPMRFHIPKCLVPYSLVFEYLCVGAHDGHVSDWGFRYVDMDPKFYWPGNVFYGSYAYGCQPGMERP